MQAGPFECSRGQSNEQCLLAISKRRASRGGSLGQSGRVLCARVVGMPMTGPRVLRTQTNTRAMERRILGAARGPCGWRLAATFEHGQWWVTNLNTGAQWSVCDAKGPGSKDGFSFELVTEGEAQ